MKTVKFTTYDDVELAADLYLPEKRAEWSPGLLICHGFGSSKSSYADTGQRAADGGVAALVLDLRGHGESGGEMDANIFNDVAAALLFLQNQPEVNPMSIAIRGTSLGGWLAIQTAAHLKDITAVAAYCPTNEMLMMTLMEEVALVQRGHASPLITGTPPRCNVNSMMQLLYRVDTIKAARRINPRPFLLVHCEGDTTVPPILSQRIYDDVNEPKTFWLLPGGDHHTAQHDPAIDARLLDWLNMVGVSTGRLREELTGC